MEEIVLGLKVRTEGAQTIGEIKQSIKDLTKEIEKTEAGTEEYAKALAKLANAKEGIKDLKEEVKALDSGDKGAAIAGLGNAIAGGFAAATGAAALFGGENEKVQQAILKVQAATAIAQGVQSIADAQRQLEIIKYIAMQKINVLQTNLQAGAESKNVVVKYASVLAQKALNAVMAMNPIGAIIVAITALVGAYYLLVGASKEEAETAEASIERNNRVADSYQKKSDMYNRINDKMLANRKDGAEKEIAIVEEAARRELKTAEGNKLLIAEIEIAKQNQIQDIKDKYAELDRKKAEEKRKADEAFRDKLKKEAEDRKALELEQTQKSIEEQKAWQEIENQTRADQLQYEIDTERNANDEIVEANSLSIEQMNKADEDFLKNEQAIAQARIGLEQAVMGNISAIGNAFIKDQDKLAKFNKRMALIQIGIDTAKAISSLVAMSNANPSNALTFGVAGAIQLATGLLSIAGNIAKAKSILSSEGSGSISGGGATPNPGGINDFLGSIPKGATSSGPPSMSQPEKDSIKSTAINGDNGSASQNLKVYVLESDISATQGRANSIKAKATYP